MRSVRIAFGIFWVPYHYVCLDALSRAL